MQSSYLASTLALPKSFFRPTHSPAALRVLFFGSHVDALTLLSKLRDVGLSEQMCITLRPPFSRKASAKDAHEKVIKEKPLFMGEITVGEGKGPSFVCADTNPIGRQQHQLGWTSDNSELSPKLPINHRNTFSIAVDIHFKREEVCQGRGKGARARRSS